MSLLQDQNNDPEKEIRHRQDMIKITKQKLLQAIVNSYSLGHRINTKTGALQKKRSMTLLQVRQHKEDIYVARYQRTQKEESTSSNIETIKRLDQEIKQLQQKTAH